MAKAHRRLKALLSIVAMVTVALTAVGAVGAEATSDMPKVDLVKEFEKDGRKVVHYEHDSLSTWGYKKSQRDEFFVVHPADPAKGQAPLYVYLHSAGGSGASELSPKRVPKEMYGLFPDCRKNGMPGRDNDWWWGYNGAYVKSGKKDELSPCENRILATVAWSVKTFDIDRNRIYLAGTSMGGSGALGMGMNHGGIFAAVSVNIPAYADHVLARMNKGPWPDPPPVVDYSSNGDEYSRGQEGLLALCGKNRYSMMFTWMPRGHMGDPVYYNEGVANFPWRSIRRNEAYPVFTNASTDQKYPGYKNKKDDDQFGQINGYFRWKNVTDTADRFVMELRLAKKEEFKLKPAFKRPELPATSTADVTFRRLQQFRVIPGKTYNWRWLLDGKPQQAGRVVADDEGLLTIVGLKITDVPCRLEITGGKSG